MKVTDKTPKLLTTQNNINVIAYSDLASYLLLSKMAANPIQYKAEDHRNAWEKGCNRPLPGLITY